MVTEPKYYFQDTKNGLFNIRKRIKGKTEHFGAYKKEEEAKEAASSVTETVQETAEEFPEPVIPQLKVKRKEVFSLFEEAVGRKTIESKEDDEHA